MEWIKCSDRLPAIWGDYLVSTGNWVGCCHYDGQFYDYSVNKMKESSRYQLPVSHWMPLPESPKALTLAEELLLESSKEGLRNAGYSEEETKSAEIGLPFKSIKMGDRTFHYKDLAAFHPDKIEPPTQ